MMKYLIQTMSMLLLCSQISMAQLFPDLGGQRVGTSAAQFLKIGLGARAIGLGETYAAIADDAEALYWNPAGLTRVDGHSLIFSHNEWLVDTKLEFAGAVYHLNQANTIGMSITYLHTEDMIETTEFQPFGTGRTFGFGDFLIGLSYARQMTTNFSFGITTKYMQETIAEVSLKSLLFDLGTFYDTGWRSVRFAMTVTNFGQDIVPDGTFMVQNLDGEFEEVTEFQSFPPPILFRIGIAANVVENEQHVITSSVQLNHPNDNTESLNFGAEYVWKDFLALRMGYLTQRVEESLSFGFGLHAPISIADFRLDYAYTNFGRLGNVNRFALQFSF